MNQWQRCQQLLTRLGAQEHGVAMVYFALILPVLIGMAGLALDGSNLFMQQRRMQTAADATALAGARLLALERNTTQINYEVWSLATANGAQTYAWSYTQGNIGVQVLVSHTFPTYFAGSLGYPTLSVQATAAASYYSVTGAGNLMPMIIQCPAGGFVYGVLYVLLDDAMNAPSSIGWVDWNGGASSADELANAIWDPNLSGVWHIGDLVPAFPGTKSASPVWDALTEKVGKTVSIPLWDTVSGTGSNVQYRICGFAEFSVATVSKANKMITGAFVRALKRGDTVGNGVDFGVRDVRLTN